MGQFYFGRVGHYSIGIDTYLAWLDCRALGLDDDALQQALIHTSKIAPSMGRSFGSQGKGFIRINLGCPRQYLEDAIRGLAKLPP